MFISDIEDRTEMGLQRNKVDKDREYLTMVLLDNDIKINIFDGNLFLLSNIL
jgi:hypothetical protein